MTLLVDVGNSALKWALLEDDRFAARGRVELASLADEAALEQCWGSLARPARILIASVAASSVTEAITDWCLRRWETEAAVLQATAQAFGIRNAYRDPARLGVDRWLALVAARARSSRPACVVDCGSAVTVDVLDGEGIHLGGLIVPGLGMMTRSLEACAQVSLDAEPDSEVPLLARDTANAVRGGTLYAAVAFIDRVMTDIDGELAQPAQHLITGGDAPIMLPLLRHPFEHVPDLVLEGLAIVARASVCAS